MLRHSAPARATPTSKPGCGTRTAACGCSRASWSRSSPHRKVLRPRGSTGDGETRVSESFTTHRTAVIALALAILAACGDDGESPADASVVEPTPDAAMTSCDDKPGSLRGKSTHTLKVGRQTRSFIYYAPSGLDPHAPAPVVLV